MQVRKHAAKRQFSNASGINFNDVISRKLTQKSLTFDNAFLQLMQKKKDKGMSRDIIYFFKNKIVRKNQTIIFFLQMMKTPTKK